MVISAIEETSKSEKGERMGWRELQVKIRWSGKALLSRCFIKEPKGGEGTGYLDI